MPGSDPRETPTLPAVTANLAPRERRGRLRLVVLRDDTLEAHPLPEHGTLSIGRVPENSICIDHPGVSRRHAVLHVGDEVRIEDLGSQNGTTVRGARIEPNRPVAVEAGDVIELGPATVVLQGVSHVSRPRRLWSHSYFEGRLEEECTRAERKAPSFAMVRVHVENASPEAVEAALVQTLRPDDLLARYGPGEYEVMLLHVAPAEAEALLAEMRMRLSERALVSKTGMACYPRDGRSPEALVAQACAAVRGGVVEPDPVGAPIVVEDPAMRRLHQLLAKVAAGPINVLLLGETGVGKEILAERLHRLSPRADKPFLRLNCGALTETLLESELFGHERGAFTGAVKSKPGLLETAQGGTVFLDEVGEMAPSAQVKLLRVLEERQVLRVGGVKPTPIDVRFVAATNRDLEAAASSGGFRQDLYFRLGGISLVVPPLRERPSEIEALAKNFLARAAAQLQRKPAPLLSDEALDLLRSYAWPGNIRELRNVIERAALLCTEGPILAEHLPVDKMSATLAAQAAARAAGPARPAGVRAETDELERQRILEALQQSGGNQRRAAELLHMPRRTFVRRLEEYNLPRPRKGPDSDE
jgi:two-component system, NtrC family, response regulator AtoC